MQGKADFKTRSTAVLTSENKLQKDSRVYKMCTVGENDKDETSVHMSTQKTSNSLFKFIQ